MKDGINEQNKFERMRALKLTCRVSFKMCRTICELDYGITINFST